jgi:hypothetical protein
MNIKEKDIESWVVKILEEEDKKVLLEQGGPVGGEIFMTPSEFSGAFIDPWMNVLKVIKAEITRTLANVVTTVRLFFTFNAEKAKRIVARHNDRMNALDKKVAALIPAGQGKDFAIAAFIFNPALYMAGSFIGSSPEKLKATKNWMAEVGITDAAGGELASADDPDRNLKKLEREKEEKGPVRKALAALEQIFLLAHHDTAGNVISEAEDEKDEVENIEDSASPIPKEQLEELLKVTGLDKIAADARKVYAESLSDIDKSLDSFGTQISKLNAVASANNVQELVSSITTLKSTVPDMDVSELEQFKSNLDQAVSKTLKKEEEVEKYKSQYMASANIDSKDASIENIDKAKLENFITQILFNANTSKLRAEIVNQLTNSLEVYENLVEAFKPKGLSGNDLEIVKSSEMWKNVQVAEQKIFKLASEVKSAVAAIEKFSPPEAVAEKPPENSSSNEVEK